MPIFSERSEKNLAECHPDLQKVAREAIKHIDFVVIEGFRGKEEQNEAYKNKKSGARWLQSPHNFTPSLAFDFMPHPEAFKATHKRWDEVIAVLLQAADTVGVNITSGRDFKRLVDRPHIELTNWSDLK